MKKHYFFITADFKFEKDYVNMKYNRDDSDTCQFTQKEVYMIEQKKSESDDVFFLNLKSHVTEALKAYAGTWLEQQRVTSPGNGWKWKLSTLSVEYISKLN